MTTLAPTFTVDRDELRREVHYTLTGLFKIEDVSKLFPALMSASQPFIEDRKGFRVLGDLREFVVQTREISEQIRVSQETSAKVGVDKMAIVYSSVLLMQQIRRASEALDCQFFKDKGEALAWLRS